MSQTIINDVQPYTQASASGGQTVYGTNWTANVESDVVVYVTPVGNQPNDVNDILSYPSDYSVSFVGSLEEVQVTLVTPSTLGDIITITRMTPADRENLYSNTNFVPSMLNNDFGILTLVDQQAQLVNQMIAPRYNYSAKIDPPIDTILPILGANQIWIKNNNNTGFTGLTIQGGQVGSGTVNFGSQNEIAFYAINGNAVSGIPTADNSVLVTNGAGDPGMSDSLPNDISASDMVLNTPTIDTPAVTNGTFSSPTVTNGTFSSPTIHNATLTNPALGTPASGVLTNCTGLPSGSGILCTTTNDNASAGQLGEFISSVIPSGSAVTAVRNDATNVTFITLTAGDWDVWGTIAWPNVGGTACTTLSGWTSTDSGPSIPDVSIKAEISILTNGTTVLAGNTNLTVPFQRYSLSTTTPIYLVGFIITNTGSNGTQCGAIYARRAR